MTFVCHSKFRTGRVDVTAQVCDEETGSDMGQDLHLEVRHLELQPNTMTVSQLRSWKLPFRDMKKIRWVKQMNSYMRK